MIVGALRDRISGSLFVASTEYTPTLVFPTFQKYAMKCKRVPLRLLRPGVKLMAPIVDPVNSRIKLLAEGTKVTESFISRLADRGVDFVILSQRDIAILTAFSPQGRRTEVPPSPTYVRSHDRNDHSDAIDQVLRFDQPPDVTADAQPLTETIHKPADCTYAEGLPIQWAEENDARINSINEFFSDTMDHGNSEIGPLRQTCVDLLQRMSEDQDALVCLACSPYESDYPSRHGVHMATVAMAIGAEMELDSESLVELGIGCLIHDIGMEAVGPRIFNTNRPLSPGQLSRLADHPVKAIEIAGRYGVQISQFAMFVLYQIHERNDGSGYPRGRTSDEIHPLAKIAAVADSLVGMLSNRKHRLAIQGYYAIAKILDEVKQGKLDATVVRALLNATSLYPLGSHVSLNNDHIGRVIRSGGDEFLRPTIEMRSKHAVEAQPTIVNLKFEPDIKITGSIPSSKAA